jgi:hypothetical protein
MWGAFSIVWTTRAGLAGAVSSKEATDRREEQKNFKTVVLKLIDFRLC